MISGGVPPPKRIRTWSVRMYVEARETAARVREAAISDREAELAKQIAKFDKHMQAILAELRELAEHDDQA